MGNPKTQPPTTRPGHPEPRSHSLPGPPATLRKLSENSVSGHPGWTRPLLRAYSPKLMRMVICVGWRRPRGPENPLWLSLLWKSTQIRFQRLRLHPRPASSASRGLPILSSQNETGWPAVSSSERVGSHFCLPPPRDSFESSTSQCLLTVGK